MNMFYQIKDSYLCRSMGKEGFRIVVCVNIEVRLFYGRLGQISLIRRAELECQATSNSNYFNTLKSFYY